MFFRPVRRFRVTDNLFLADGDMFFSTMQTLTVSVNVVGIMGKGLASRAKYQFPDVYVVYQDACRHRKLGMGKPYLYKREAFVDEELADEPGTLPEVNTNKWFLLFATKRHWRDRADLQAIREGLRWVRDNYAAEGIKSLAMPALGCGLGKLDWQDVGPVMCQELANLGIQVAIYLPRERQIPEEHLSPQYLLSSVESKGGQAG
jgi:O-acetyl-ADP-ribose deacetylase (regulator of RNase III)